MCALCRAESTSRALTCTASLAVLPEPRRGLRTRRQTRPRASRGRRTFFPPTSSTRQSTSREPRLVLHDMVASVCVRCYSLAPPFPVVFSRWCSPASRRRASAQTLWRTSRRQDRLKQLHRCCANAPVPDVACEFSSHVTRPACSCVLFETISSYFLHCNLGT